MFHVPESKRLTSGPLASSAEDGNNGCFRVVHRLGGRAFRVIASDGMGWDHVSVSLSDRCPTWDEMCFIKSLFWDEGDCVVQYHPAKKDYVDFHPCCLHLWRPTEAILPMPPSIMVGPK